MAKSIRIDEKTYRKLCEHAGKLQANLKRPVSIDETIWYLIKTPKPQNRISDLAGTWKITDEDLSTIKKSLRWGWRGWGPPKSA